MAEKYQSREERRKRLNSQGSQKSKKKKGSLVKKIFLFLVALGILGMLAGAATFAYLVKDTPKLDKKLLKDPIASKIYDKDGKFVTEVGAMDSRDYVTYDQIPKVVENAFIATEDARFYKHHGIDVVRLGGAVMANITHGFGSEGGSTITQQVVKNSILTPEKTIKRKVQEAYLAYQLEQHYTKHQILEMYVNKIFMSENAHGVGTAAKIYFGKELKDVTLPQAAMLAGMPQSPNNYNPFLHPETAEKRRNIVLSLMHKHGYITKTEMENAIKTPITTGLLPEDQRKKDTHPYDAFVDAVIEEVEDNGNFDIYSDGLSIYTTLDPKAQKHVEDVLNTNDYVQYPDDKFQAGVTLLDTKTGEVRAVGGGRNQQNVKRAYNYAMDIKRQPGSTVKPILDYGPAIEYLQWGTYHMIEDKKITYTGGKEFGNWDNKYMGPMTIRKALALSRNTPAVQTLQQVGLDRAKNFAINLGIPLKEIYESYAIGGFGGKTGGIAPIQVAGAYAAFGNNGYYTKPYFVKKIALRDGTEINLKHETKPVMKDYTAFMISDMLKSVLEYGTGTKARIPGLPVAGKSGTTNYTDDQMRQFGITNSHDVPDAWFTGYTTNYTASVWTGYADLKNPIHEGSDQKIAQGIFKSVMSYASEDVKTADFTIPKSVTRVRVEKDTMPAKLAGPYTPEDRVSYEYAVRGHAPKQVSEKYTKMDAPNNVNAKYDQGAITLSWDYPQNGKDVKFRVDASSDNGWQQSFTVSDKSLQIPNAVPGSSYKFSVTAISGSDKSDSVTASVSVPAAPDTGDNNGNTGDGNNGNGNDNGNNDNGNGNNDNGNGNNGGTPPPATKPPTGGGGTGGTTGGTGGTTGGTGGTTCGTGGTTGGTGGTTGGTGGTTGGTGGTTGGTGGTTGGTGGTTGTTGGTTTGGTGH